MPIKHYGTCKRGAGWIVRRRAGKINVRYTRRGACVLDRATAIKVAHADARYYGLRVLISRRPRRKHGKRG